MIELRTLGSLELKTSDGRAIYRVLRQPKRSVLLCYLGVARPRGFHRRDTLLGLFWPDLNMRHARAALRQALHFLRRSLGHALVQSRGSGELAVTRTGVWCDAVALDDAMDAGDAAAALELYRGDFLRGVFVAAGAPELDAWIEEERARLRRRAVVAARTLAAQCERKGDFATAIEWARRATTLSDDDERVVRELVALLDRSGNRSAALHAYSAFARRLGDWGVTEPSPETRALIDVIGSRAVPDVLTQ